MLTIFDKTFIPFIDAVAIKESVNEVAGKINRDYANKNPLFIAILNGSFIFAADLFRCLTIPANISFIKLASYKGTLSTGNVITAIGFEEEIFNRHIIILEDIIDTGKTLSTFLPQLKRRQPASIKIATFLLKKEAPQYGISADYTCFEIPTKFVVGYGLDYNGYGRNLPALYQLHE